MILKNISDKAEKKAPKKYIETIQKRSFREDFIPDNNCSRLVMEIGYVSGAYYDESSNTIKKCEIPVDKI